MSLEAQSTLLALASALGFASATVANRVALRHMTTLAGATVSIPAVTTVLWLLAPWWLRDTGAHLDAVAVFAAIGLLFPATVTLMIYESNARLGPTTTATVSSTAPLFAFAAAVLFLGEVLSLSVTVATVMIVAGIAMLSWNARPMPRGGASRPRDLLLPTGAAVVRGASQVAMKFGLALWPSAYAATLVGYTVSTMVVLLASRLAGRRHPLSYTRRGIVAFLVVGAFNGSAMFLMYAALAHGEVVRVAPIVASYPLLTLLLSALFLREERFTHRQLGGIALTVAGVALCVQR